MPGRRRREIERQTEVGLRRHSAPRQNTPAPGDGPGPELIINGGFDVDLTGWTDSDTGTGVSEWADGKLSIVGTDASNRAQRRTTFATVVGRTYLVAFDAVVLSGSPTIRIGTTAGGTDLVSSVITGGEEERTFVATTTTTHLQFGVLSAPGEATIDNVSARVRL